MTASTLITDYVGRGTHAARPVTPNIPTGATALYYETDTGVAFTWSGSVWVAVNAAVAVATIASSGLSNVVGTGAAVADTNAGVLISATAANIGAAYATPVPATPYSVVAKIVAPVGCPAMFWSDGTKYQYIYVLPIGATTPGQVNVQSNSTLTTFSATNYSASWGLSGAGPLFYKLRDDGTNVTFSLSADGTTFVTAYTVAKASGYLGGSGYTRIGVACGFQYSSPVSQATVLSWTQGV